MFLPDCEGAVLAGVPHVVHLTPVVQVVEPVVSSVAIAV
jgi:hypothetical protein